MGNFKVIICQALSPGGFGGGSADPFGGGAPPEAAGPDPFSDLSSIKVRRCRLSR